MPDFPWPDGKRCAVALTFDMDGETVPFVLDPPNARRRLSLISEAMYDGRVGTPRILDVLDSYEMKSTFFIPGFSSTPSWSRRSSPAATRLAVAATCTSVPTRSATRRRSGS
jgi:peptidoglycan/xylan/chitin deacetylase (PgdA/CDA1 family)